MTVQNKDSDVSFLQKLNEVLVSTKMTQENLNNHKLMIQTLINVTNKIREEIFIMNSKVEIAEKELKFWIYDFDKIKTNKKIREELAKVHVDKLRNNLNEELKHKR
jgi:hypothetical protein